MPDRRLDGGRSHTGRYPAAGALGTHRTALVSAPFGPDHAAVIVVRSKTLHWSPAHFSRGRPGLHWFQRRPTHS